MRWSALGYVVSLIFVFTCTKSTRNWVRPKGLSAEIAVGATNAALDVLYAQGFESERLDVVESRLLIRSKINGDSKKVVVDSASTFSIAYQNHVDRFDLITGNFDKERNPWIVTWFDVHKNMKPALARSFVVAGFEYSPWVFGFLPGNAEHPLLGADFLNWTQGVIFTRFGFLPFRQLANQPKI